MDWTWTRPPWRPNWIWSWPLCDLDHQIIEFNYISCVLVINGWIVFRLGQNLGDQTEYDLDLYMILTIEVKLLNLTIINCMLLMNWFDLLWPWLTNLIKIAVTWPMRPSPYLVIKKSSVAPLAWIFVIFSIFFTMGNHVDYIEHYNYGWELQGQGIKNSWHNLESACRSVVLLYIHCLVSDIAQ